MGLQEELFDAITKPPVKPIVQSISFDEGEIMQSIIDLHSPAGFELDPCYSIGAFYRRFNIPEPKYKFDIKVQKRGVTQASADKLPMDDNSVQSIMFDPPFVIGGKVKTDSSVGSDVIAKRFSNFQSFDELKTMYSNCLKEFARILKPDGVLTFKCQDCVAGGKNHFTHSWVMYEALKQGFYPKDLFILLAKNRLTDKRKQQHARKFHCYYWVFEKKKCDVDYSHNN